MTPAEAGMILAVAAVYDGRLHPGDETNAVLKAEAWAAALDEDMTPDWARGRVIRHYADETEVVTPAHLNRAWRRERVEARRREVDERRLREITSERENAIPMPDYIRDQIRALMRGTRIPE